MQHVTAVVQTVTVFTISGEPVVLKVERLKLMQMGNVLHRYLCNFVVLASGDRIQKANKSSEEAQNVAVRYCLQ